MVHNGRVIAKGMNATNVTRDGTKHAEFMLLAALLSYYPGQGAEGAPGAQISPQLAGCVVAKPGHLHPYGQKLHPAARVDKSIIRECVLYVTVEPCIMCASLLRQLGIKKVYFGAVNDKFGGCGGVFRIHKNSDPICGPLPPPQPQQRDPPVSRFARSGKSSSAPGTGITNGTTTDTAANAGDVRPEQKPQSTIAIAEGTVPNAGVGDGGNVEDGFDVEGGWGRDEAVNLLRQFYVQENGRGKSMVHEPSRFSLMLSPP